MRSPGPTAGLEKQAEPAGTAPAVQPEAESPAEPKPKPAAPGNAETQRNDVAAIEAECHRAEERLFYRSEAGLFNDKVTIVRAEIAADIRQAREDADAGALPQASEALMRAYGQLHDAIQQRGFGWSAIHLHALHLYVYYALVLAGFLWLGLTDDEKVRALAAGELWSIPASMAAYGMLGGLVRGLFWLPKKIEASSFRVRFTMVYVIGPWLAMLLGMLAYVLLDAGLLALGDAAGSTAPAGASDGPSASSSADGLAPGFIAAAILAGFSWEWITDRIDARLNGS